jgi:uncharacterized protein YgbK (DUF1537 family)
MLKVPEKFSMRVGNGDRLLSDETIVVGEAETTADVQSWTASCNPQMLPAGGSEFFNALLSGENLISTNGHETSLTEISGRKFFVVGTATDAARKFVASAKRRKTPVFSLPQELMWGAEFTPAAVEAITQRIVAAFESQACVILNVGLPQVQDLAVARRLAENIVRIAERVLQQVLVTRIFAEGGATAAELVRRMGWKRLEVLHEHAPGVATLAVGGGKKLLLTIKPGTYAWPAKWT